MTDPRRLIGLIDLTRLEEADDRRVAEDLCARAQTPLGPVAAVCLMPHLVADARELLDHTPIRVATVADFPEGRGEIAEVIREVQGAVAAGAHEVDVVVPWRAHVRGERHAVHVLVAACVKACAGDAQLKAILETGSHPDVAATRAMADAALEAGADFVKTSTGKHGPGASAEAVDVLLSAVRDHGRGGLKVSGGVRTAEDAHAYLAQADAALGTQVDAARFRIGASSLLDALLPGLTAKELLRSKRDGASLSPEQLRWIARGIADGGLTDAQVAAWAMAVFFRGLDPTELPAFTLGMRDSGTVLDWSHEDRPVLDKHSTGGVGDKVSLVLAPLLAACGAAVPMLSGRGLGHTGGTLDKLEAIPGYVTQPDPGRLRRAIADAGCAVVGQTDDLAPADRRLYAVRDATGSVEAVPLITSSILAKKLAAGLQGLVLDVKHGSGAFFTDLDRARGLARTLVDVAGAAGLPAVALLTDMDRVLGRTAGNALEVREAMDVLTGDEPAEPRLLEVTLALARAVLDLHGLDADPAARLADGSAAERFAAMVASLGGPADLLEHPDHHLPVAPVQLPVLPAREGVVTAHRTRDLGLAVTHLGGGHLTEGDRIDHAVGLAAVAPPGARVGPDRPLCVVHARDAAAAQRAAAAVRALMPVGDEAPPDPPVVTEELR